MEFKTVQEKVCYGMGRRIAQDFASQKFEGFSAEAMIQGLADGLAGRELAVPGKELSAAFDEFNRLMTRKQAEASEKSRKEGLAYQESNRSRPGVTVTSSGLQYEVLKDGDGDIPGPKDVVRVKYKGTFINGEIFDSTDKNGHGDGIEFPVNGVIAGWTEALQLMRTGSIWKLVIPSELAYGESGAGSIPPGSTLVFEVELLAIAMKSKE